MTRTTFFKHFELLADQPDAVAKMRELILRLAGQPQLRRSDLFIEIQQPSNQAP